MLALLLSLGKWRYFLTGTAAALFLGLLLRLPGTLMALLTSWRRFSGECVDADKTGAVRVCFIDENAIQHHAAFFLPATVSPGDSIEFAIRTDRFLAGSYPDTLSAADAAANTIRSIAQHRRLMRRAVFRTLLLQLTGCAIALGIFLFTMKHCFP